MPAFVALPISCAPVRVWSASLSPWENRRILITAPSRYAAQIAPLLLARHARPIHAPLVSTETIFDASGGDLEDALLRLSDYEVVIFTARHLVKSFSEKLLAFWNNREQAALMLRASNSLIAILGTDAHAVSEYLNITPHILPPTPTLKALAEFLRSDGRLENARVLCPTSKYVDMQEPSMVHRFLGRLEDAGFSVHSPNACTIAPRDRSDLQAELGLLQDNCIDSVIISTAEEATALKALLSEEEHDSFTKKVETGEIVVMVHGSETAADVCNVLELKNVIVPPEWASFEEIADALDSAFVPKFSKNGLLLPNL